MAKDGQSAEFTLRPGIKFHNGDPVTAEDVKFSFERYRGGGAKIMKENIKEIQSLGPIRVRFIFKEPWPDFPAFYGTFVTGAGWVVPKRHVERVGEEAYRKAPVGAGPYKFVSFNAGVELVLEAFEGYWRKTPSMGPRDRRYVASTIRRRHGPRGSPPPPPALPGAASRRPRAQQRALCGVRGGARGLDGPLASRARYASSGITQRGRSPEATRWILSKPLR